MNLSYYSKVYQKLYFFNLPKIPSLVFCITSDKYSYIYKYARPRGCVIFVSIFQAISQYRNQRCNNDLIQICCPLFKTVYNIRYLLSLRKYATGEHLEKLVEESFSKVKVILDQKAESGEAFNPMITTSLLIYNIIAAMTLGKV